MAEAIKQVFAKKREEVSYHVRLPLVSSTLGRSSAIDGDYPLTTRTSREYTFSRAPGSPTLSRRATSPR